MVGRIRLQNQFSPLFICRNKECPTCRKKLVSKRSLRPDPNFDALISKIYPSRDEYEAHQERVLARISKHNNQQALSHSIEEGLKIQALNRQEILEGCVCAGRISGWQKFVHGFQVVSVKTVVSSNSQQQAQESCCCYLRVDNTGLRQPVFSLYEKQLHVFINLICERQNS